MKDVNVGGKADTCSILCRLCKQLLLQRCAHLTLQIITFLHLCGLIVPAGKAAHMQRASPPLS